MLLVNRLLAMVRVPVFSIAPPRPRALTLVPAVLLVRVKDLVPATKAASPGNISFGSVEAIPTTSLTPLLTHLVRAKRLSPRERQSLRELLDELDAKSKLRDQSQ